jgi:hypothetical protein
MLRLRSLLAWSLVCAALVAPAGATARQAQPAGPPAAYLFVEIWTEVSGTGTLPQLCIDFPGYQFEPSSGRMARFFEPLPALRPSDLGFLGEGQSRTGAAGCGASSQLAPIASLPYTTTIALGTGATSGVHEETRTATVVLRSVDQSGALSATIDGADVTLPPGARWQHAAGADLASAPFNGHYLVTASVANYGWNDRARIEGITQSIWLPLVRLN